MLCATLGNGVGAEDVETGGNVASAEMIRGER
jgi:hypothetical protein